MIFSESRCTLFRIMRVAHSRVATSRHDFCE
jgi:hypothetical protein